MFKKEHNATVVRVHFPSHQPNVQQRLGLLLPPSLFFSCSTAMSQILPLQGAVLQEIIASWVLSELEGLYISCQPQRLRFFSPPHCVALAGQLAVRLRHAEITVPHRHFKRLFPGRAHIHGPDP